MAFGGVFTAGFALIELRADKVAQLALNNTIMFVGVIDDGFARLYVFLEGFMAGIDHDAGESFVDAVTA